MFPPHYAEGNATFAKDELEGELRRLKQQLSHEAELRAKEAKEFADRLKEVHFVHALGAIHIFVGIRTLCLWFVLNEAVASKIPLDCARVSRCYRGMFRIRSVTYSVHYRQAPHTYSICYALLRIGARRILSLFVSLSVAASPRLPHATEGRTGGGAAW